MKDPNEKDDPAFSDAFGRWLDQRRVLREMFGEDDEPVGELTRAKERPN